MTEFKNLEVGEVLSETQYYKVKEINTNSVDVVNDLGQEIELSGEYVNVLLQSASQFGNTEKVNKTKLTELIKGSSYQAITVNFNKQVKEADVVEEIMGAYEASTPKDFKKALKSAVKRSQLGEERTMVGRHFGTTDEFGRIHFIDMNIERKEGSDYDTRQRLVDPRTANWAIINGVKYVVK